MYVITEPVEIINDIYHGADLFDVCHTMPRSFDDVDLYSVISTVPYVEKVRDNYLRIHIPKMELNITGWASHYALRDMKRRSLLIAAGVYKPSFVHEGDLLTIPPLDVKMGV